MNDLHNSILAEARKYVGYFDSELPSTIWSMLQNILELEEKSRDNYPQLVSLISSDFLPAINLYYKNKIIWFDLEYFFLDLQEQFLDKYTNLILNKFSQTDFIVQSMVVCSDFKYKIAHENLIIFLQTKDFLYIGVYDPAGHMDDEYNLFVDKFLIVLRNKINQRQNKNCLILNRKELSSYRGIQGKTDIRFCVGMSYFWLHLILKISQVKTLSFDYSLLSIIEYTERHLLALSKEELTNIIVNFTANLINKYIENLPVKKRQRLLEYIYYNFDNVREEYD